MKKLLVLSLVLGIASLATAAMSFTTDGDLGAGAHALGINIAAAGTADYGQYMVWADSAVASVSAGTVLLGNLSEDKSFYDDGAGGAYYPTTYYLHPAMTAAGLPTDGSVSANFGIISDTSGGPLNGQAVSFSIDALAAGTLTLYTSANGAPGTWAVADTINIVPEPATMAILGLGALMLRRKK